MGSRRVLCYQSRVAQNVILEDDKPVSSGGGQKDTETDGDEADDEANGVEDQEGSTTIGVGHDCQRRPLGRIGCHVATSAESGTTMLE
jgi:hypothetical protein